ncbi:hypothetical protein GCM10018980_77110 [Streptomyces capoamus]|uniref:Uncharacterized protein n=1 Tax=Streptomyces capoamus TaxID=68183 RepID=A0A919KGC4_9ACTN|nr:hypothetical protein GCM10018980_77110 [Streptomyces capoamus]
MRYVTAHRDTGPLQLAEPTWQPGSRGGYGLPVPGRQRQPAQWGGFQEKTTERRSRRSEAPVPGGRM